MMPEAQGTEVQGTKDERSLGELFGDLAREISTLFRAELDLAKTEMSQKAATVGKHAAMIAAGGAVAYAGLLALVAALILLLANWMPWWASALLVGLVVAGAGGFLVMNSINALKRADLAPTQTLETIKEDVQWAKGQTRQTG